MRVLMLGWEFPPHVSGGLGTACRGLTEGLSRLGVGVLFVVPRTVPRSTGDGDDEGDGAALRHVRLVGADGVCVGGASGPRGGARVPGFVDVLPVDAMLSPYVSERDVARACRPAARPVADGGRMVVARPGPGAGSHYGPGLLAEVERYAKAAEVIARRERFDVIHAHDWMTYPAGIAAGRASGKPLVVHVHACEHDRSGPALRHGAAAPGGIAAVEQRGFDAADAIVCVSHYTARTIGRRYRVDPDRVRVVHNGVASPPRGLAPHRARASHEPVVLFLGRVTRQKGPHAFLDAAARIARARPDARFVVAGSGDLLPGVVERAAAMGLARRIHFTGFVEGRDLERVFARSDVLVMPSVSEPFGIAPLEALARGVPVVVSRQSGVVEVLPGVATADFWDAEDVAAKVLALLNDPGAARRAGVRGREAAGRLRWVDAARRVRSVYSEVVDGAAA